LEVLKGRDHPEVVDIDGKIILELVLEKYVGKLWDGCIWLRTGASGRPCERGIEPTVSTKVGKFLD
jgi:hypothetical protein